MTKTIAACIAAVLLRLLSVLPSAAATIAGTVTIHGRPAAEAVIYLESTKESPPAHAHVIIDQKNLAFVPGILPVVRGTTVEFTNSDGVQHNVFSPSEIAGRFDLGTKGPGTRQSVTLNEPGEVLILCNIHMEMEGHILVLKDPYFSVVAQDGRYRIPDVPPGTYMLKVWRPNSRPYTETIDLPSEGIRNMDVRIEN